MESKIAKRHVQIFRQEAAYTKEIADARAALLEDQYKEPLDFPSVALATSSILEKRQQYRILKTNVINGLQLLLRSPVSANLTELKPLRKRNFTEARDIEVPEFGPLGVFIQYNQPTPGVGPTGTEQVMNGWVQIAGLPEGQSLRGLHANLVQVLDFQQHIFIPGSTDIAPDHLLGEVDRLHDEFGTLRAIHTAAGLRQEEVNLTS